MVAESVYRVFAFGQEHQHPLKSRVLLIVVSMRWNINGVGLPKSGTVSLAGLFGNYRSLSEPIKIIHPKTVEFVAHFW
ncbi:MAG: hypothetical protein HZB37_11130 [Planctomycetes bacterium]|nr:hypothetical protein [Planctomycetota bacterium]